ncbi:tRNA pseudouridine(55) synthase TruB [Pleionea sp. CnH1-48]|uniref:tRNA pseudouridine(55) synthase TruB n=1 Tax=Pleionea sp. CnH1-48 TaxID=2954494 RepID=UPI0020974AC2|nr:tRNA pseudouridine(55) synthase TruB [Pleionea sp. CnH1-48]MCO7225039.1 tRNA pseudouridine(55) synthase TruB [Pleionea sp. CnH1-48]
MARRRFSGRPVNGILLLDKPTGATSNHALQEVKRLFNAAKAGHTGSLDPLACGMLPICFGEATKFSQFLLNSDKAYRVTAKLGVKTTTGDSEGEIREELPVDVSEQQLHDAVMSFLGESMQVPSMYSALKHKGQPLYKLARQGIEVEREARPIHLYNIEIEDFSADNFTLYVECSKGTYIRSLVEDIGEKLGCGAHVTYLYRDWVADFQPDAMVSLESLRDMKEQKQFEEMDALLLPIDAALCDLPEVTLIDAVAAYFLQGQAVSVPDAPSEGMVKVFNSDRVFLGVAELNAEMQLAPKRLVNL